VVEDIVAVVVEDVVVEDKLVIDVSVVVQSTQAAVMSKVRVAFTDVVEMSAESSFQPHRREPRYSCSAMLTPSSSAKLPPVVLTALSS
jgi:hypothetical protein